MTEATKAKKSSKAAKPSKKGGGLKIRLVRSVIGTTQHQREVVLGLGLRRIRHTVERHDTAEIRGMIAKVKHLVEIVEA